MLKIESKTLFDPIKQDLITDRITRRILQAKGGNRLKNLTVTPFNLYEISVWHMRFQ